jgi:hypothetical protein
MLSLREFATGADPSALGYFKPSEDFVPTRDRSDCGLSCFSYKITAEEMSPMPEKRGQLIQYCPYLFGQIQWIGVTVSPVCYLHRSFLRLFSRNTIIS